MSSPIPTFRFAPSPNGRLHLGHAYSALLNQKFAQQTSGKLLLRIEDIDTTRCTPEFTRLCISDLTWLGFKWHDKTRTQSEHWHDYHNAANQLKAKNLIYPCFCTRTTIAQTSTEQDPDGAPLYAGTCSTLNYSQAQSRINAGEPHSWRLHMSRALALFPAPHHYTAFDIRMHTTTITTNTTRWGDAILVRKDTPTSYHLSVIVDDAIQNITHIVRGKDLEAATDLHILLQTILGLPTPQYHHHNLITHDGQKLSKSKGSETIEDLRNKGMNAKDIHNLLFATKTA